MSDRGEPVKDGQAGRVVKERIVRVGKQAPLAGIISEPKELDVNKPAVIIFNSGVMHHIGSCRLSVKLARAFSNAGNLALRFDFSGIGDSEPRRGIAPFEESAPAEAMEVMDYLERKRGIKTFVLYGLCSGADAAYQTALLDNRVVGFAQIDPYCYRTPRYYFHYYASRFFVLERWLSSAKRLWKAVSGGKTTKNPAETAGVEEEYFELPSYVRVFPPRGQIAAGLSGIVKRGVANCVIFTGSEADYNYQSQYTDSFRDVGFGALLNLVYLNEANHIITDPRHQEVVVSMISRWIEDLSNNVTA